MGQKISSTVPGTGNHVSDHKVSWANGTERDAREPRNEKTLGPVIPASGSKKSASGSLSEPSAFST